MFDDSEFYVWKKMQPHLLFLSFSGSFGEESGNWRREEEEKNREGFYFYFSCGFYSQYYHAFIYV